MTLHRGWARRITGLVVAVFAVGAHAAVAHEPVEHRLILNRSPASIAISERGLSSLPPAVATDDAELNELWDRFGYTLSDGVLPGGPEYVPPPPPPVAFGRQVAVFVVEHGPLVEVVRDGRRLVLRFESGIPSSNTGPPKAPVKIVGVARSGLPPSPFTLVQEKEGEVAYQVQVDLGPAANTLPRTGSSTVTLALLAAVLTAVGALVVRIFGGVGHVGTAVGDVRVTSARVAAARSDQGTAGVWEPVAPG